MSGADVTAFADDPEKIAVAVAGTIKLQVKDVNSNSGSAYGTNEAGVTWLPQRHAGDALQDGSSAAAGDPRIMVGMQRAVNIRTAVAIIIVVAWEAEATAGMSDEMMPGKGVRSEAVSCETLAAYSAEMFAADSTHMTGGDACHMPAADAGSEAAHVTTTEAAAKAAHVAATAAETTTVAATSTAAACISGGGHQAQCQRSRCEYLECTSFHDLILSIDAAVAMSAHTASRQQRDLRNMVSGHGETIKMPFRQITFPAMDRRSPRHSRDRSTASAGIHAA